MTNEEIKFQKRKEAAIVHIYIYLKLKGYKTVQKLLLNNEEEGDEQNVDY